jgi:Spy/CpxP family protein refolding chaperone
MQMLRKTATIAIAAALGGGSALGIAAACGEDRSGDVKFEGDTGTNTTGTSTTGTEATGTETTGTTGTETTGTTGTETTP